MLFVLLLLFGAPESSSCTFRTALNSDGRGMEKSSTYFFGDLDEDLIVLCLSLFRLRTSQKAPESKRTAPRALATPMPTNPPAGKLFESVAPPVTLDVEVESDEVAVGAGVAFGGGKSVVEGNRSARSEE